MTPEARTRRPYDARKACAADCTIDADVIRTCRAILQERGAWTE